MPRFRKRSYTKSEFFKGKHRFEHWYRDNTVYFITSKCRDGFPAFATDEAKQILWDRFSHYTEKYGFIPWVTTLLNNHYHTLGYLKSARTSVRSMQHLHGSVAKLVDDLLPERHLPFWRTKGNKDYFDGCIRDVVQATRAFRYTKLQSVRAHLVTGWRNYPHTNLQIDVDRAIERAVELHAFLEDLPYARYDRRRRMSPARRTL
jgi:hypothetical protein